MYSRQFYAFFHTQIKKKKWYESEEHSPQFPVEEASKSEKAVWLDPLRRCDKQSLVRNYNLDFFITPVACKSTCSFLRGVEEIQPPILLTSWHHSALRNSDRRGCATWLHFHQAQQIVEASLWKTRRRRKERIREEGIFVFHTPFTLKANGFDVILSTLLGSVYMSSFFKLCFGIHLILLPFISLQTVKQAIPMTGHMVERDH